MNSGLFIKVDIGGQISNRFLLFIYPIISSIMLRGRGGTPKSIVIFSVIRITPEAIGGANAGGVITRPIAAFHHSLRSIAWTLGILRWGVAKIIIFKPVCYPLKHIAGHIHHTVRTCVIWIASHGSCIWILIFSRNTEISRALIKVIPPGVNSAIRSPGCFLPLCLGR